jgi:hypothetical protein
LARLLLVLTLVAAAVAAALVARGDAAIPPGWRPWGPPEIAAPPGPFTRLQLAAIGTDAEDCFEALRRAGIDVARVPDRLREDGCGWRGAGRVEPGDLRVRSGFVGTCPLIAALAMLERHVVDPAAREHLGAGVRTIEHLGVYACRNLYGRAAGRRSEHAGANAIDLSAFRLTDGRTVSVARHWEAEGPEGRFLRAVGAGACRVFDVVLGPGYNRAHADHFHLDMGRFRACS